MQTTHHTPAVRAALLAALHSPDHTLSRVRGGFAAFDSKLVVTRRTANALHNAGLVAFDQRDFPSSVTLTPLGLTHARMLDVAKAVAA